MFILSFSISFSILYKQYFNQLKSLIAAIVQAYKKKISKDSLILNIIHDFENNQLISTDIKNTKKKYRTWFHNKSINKSNFDIEAYKYSN